jgi:hypothetical protein
MARAIGAPEIATISTWRQEKMAILTKRVMVLGPLLIGVNALLIWTLEHTELLHSPSCLF